MGLIGSGRTRAGRFVCDTFPSSQGSARAIQRRCRLRRDLLREACLAFRGMLRLRCSRRPALSVAPPQAVLHQRCASSNRCPALGNSASARRWRPNRRGSPALPDQPLGGQFTFHLERLDRFKSRWPMGRQLNIRQALQPFPKGIIGGHVTLPHQAVGQRLLENFGSGASGAPSQGVAQQLFSLRCEVNLHELSIAQVGKERKSLE